MSERLAFWCAYHEAIVTAEHFYRCELLRPPPGPVHFHRSCVACVKNEWEKIARLLP